MKNGIDRLLADPELLRQLKNRRVALVAHPASTSHGRLTEAQRQAAGVRQGLIRVAVGLEHLKDLQADLSLGLDSLT